MAKNGSFGQSRKSESIGPRARSPRVLGLTVFGPPFDPRSWSGSSWRLFSSLRQKGALDSAHSVDLTTVQKLLSALRNPSISRRRTYFNLMKSETSFNFRTRNASRILGAVGDDFDAILQISALFLTEPRKKVLRCSYHDGNTALSRHAASSGAQASPRVLAQSWNCEQRVYRSLDLIFTMSEWLRQSMIRDFGVDEGRVLAVGAGPNLSYLEDLKCSPPRQRDYRSKNILFIGVEFERKGGPTLLEAFRHVRRELPTAKLRLVGCNPQVQEPGVQIVGMLDKSDPAQEAQLRRCCEDSSLFVLPTRYEPFGIAFVEAMYHRLPCIGTKLCAIPEIIDDGETGFLVPAEDPRALADRMILLLNDERLARTMGERGFERASARFSWEIVVDHMLKAIGARIH